VGKKGQRWTKDQEAKFLASVAEKQASGFYRELADRKKIRAAVVRESYRAEGREKAQRSSFNLFLAGCMLYWAEGSKTDRCSLTFTNSDPDMIRLFMRFLREACEVPDNRIRVRVHGFLNNGITREAIESYWLNTTELPNGQLRKGQWDAYGTSKRTKRTLLYGTAHVYVCDTRVMQMVMGGISSFAGIAQR
jgi:hypothetical protein